MFYEKVFREFNRRRVKYVVIGGIALNLHGVPRTTSDLDVTLAMEPSNLKKVAAVMKELGFRPRLPVDIDSFTDPANLEKWRMEKNLKAFTFWNPRRAYEEVDVFISSPIDFDDLYTDRKVVKAGMTIPIASLQHLIKFKEGTGREQDESDVRALKKLEVMK